MARHIVDIELTDDEEKMVRWLAQQDSANRYLGCKKVTVKEELRGLLALQIWEEIQINADEVGIDR